MKKFSVLAAFVFAVMVSSTALAATWTPIDAGKDTSTVFVDKSSIKRGVQCATLGLNRSDGFTANIKIEIAIPGEKSFVMINSIGFFTDNGVKKKCYLAQIDENGNVVQDSSFKPEISAADGSDGEVWPAVYDYIQKNLP